jgi:hypothetical protein
MRWIERRVRVSAWFWFAFGVMGCFHMGVFIMHIWLYVVV